MDVIEPNAAAADDPKQAVAKLVRLASPRGFCAGVERAVRTVEEALAIYGAPVFVRHEIVHNEHVVARLEVMGAVFVEELDQTPPDRPVILSAHGSPRSVYIEASKRNLTAIDATCPLVLKVHNQVRRHAALGHHLILIGHAGHPEVIGTIGQAPAGAVTLVETTNDALSVEPPTGPLAYVSQTTLSVDDASEIIAVLKRRFPHIIGPRKSDICYATSNRQNAVKQISPGADVVLVVGSSQSSNSRRLVECAIRAGARRALLVDDPASFDLASVNRARIIGVTSGASVPEYLVELLLKRLAEVSEIRIETIELMQEDVVFKQPMMMTG